MSSLRQSDAQRLAWPTHGSIATIENQVLYGPLIEQQMQQFLAQVPGVERVSAEMVLRPPWSPEMMSDEAKAALGVF